MGLRQGDSADTAGGWLNHYSRMLRWGERAKRRSYIPVGSSRSESVDFALAFFVWAHSLREWLIETKAVGRAELDAQLQNTTEWGLCRDLANRSRHYELKKSPIDKDWSLIRTFDDFHSPNNAPYEQWVVLFGHDQYNLAEVVHRIELMWNQVLTDLKIHPALSDSETWAMWRKQ